MRHAAPTCKTYHTPQSEQPLTFFPFKGFCEKQLRGGKSIRLTTRGRPRPGNPNYRKSEEAVRVSLNPLPPFFSIFFSERRKLLSISTSTRANTNQERARDIAINGRFAPHHVAPCLPSFDVDKAERRDHGTRLLVFEFMLPVCLLFYHYEQLS